MAEVRFPLSTTSAAVKFCSHQPIDCMGRMFEPVVSRCGPHRVSGVTSLSVPSAQWPPSLAGRETQRSAENRPESGEDRRRKMGERGWKRDEHISTYRYRSMINPSTRISYCKS